MESVRDRIRQDIMSSLYAVHMEAHLKEQKEKTGVRLSSPSDVTNG